MGSGSANVKVEGQGIDRRTLIRRAAIGGAVAWTAPVIIGSLTSPAAAFTFTGCVILKFNGGSCQRTCSNATETCGTNTITPCPVDLCTQFQDACVSITGDCQNGPATVTTGVGCCTSCKITAAFGRTGPTSCIAGTISGDQKSVNFPIPPGNDKYNQLIVKVECG